MIDIRRVIVTKVKPLSHLQLSSLVNTKTNRNEFINTETIQINTIQLELKNYIKSHF